MPLRPLMGLNVNFEAAVWLVVLVFGCKMSSIRLRISRSRRLRRAKSSPIACFSSLFSVMRNFCHLNHR